MNRLEAKFVIYYEVLTLWEFLSTLHYIIEQEMYIAMVKLLPTIFLCLQLLLTSLNNAEIWGLVWFVLPLCRLTTI